jgi:hypothetical protein
MKKTSLLFLILILLLVFAYSCKHHKESIVSNPKTALLLEHANSIIFNNEWFRYRWLKDHQTIYIYPTMDYFRTIEPFYYNITILDLDTSYRVKPIPLNIPDSLRHMHDYYPYKSLDSLILRDEVVCMFSPLMPTTTKGEYVMEIVSFQPTGEGSRMHAVILNYYKINGKTYSFLRYEEYEMGVYRTNIRPYIEQMKIDNRKMYKH